MVEVVAKAFTITFRQWPYALLALAVAVLLLLIAVWLPNLSFLWYLFTGPGLHWTTGLNFLGQSFAILKLNSTLVSRILLMIMVILAGLNVSLVTYYLKRRLALAREIGAGLLGTILGLVGIGCASCGSILLFSLFGLGATAGFLTLLPLRGLEFGIVSIILLAIALVMVSKKITHPLVCAR